MSDGGANTVEYRTLYAGKLVSIADYSCHARSTDLSPEEESDRDRIVLMRSGAFSRHFRRRQVTADVNQVVFFSRGAPYRVSHPAGCGDRGTMFAVEPGVLRDIIRRFDPSVDEDKNTFFKFVSAPCSPSLFWKHRQFVVRLKQCQGDPLLTPLWIDETALQIIGEVLASAFEHNGLRGKAVRLETSRDHADRTEAAKTYLASRLSDRITLDDVAHAVHSSPFNFARIFQRQAGMPIHRYLTRLRLRAAIEQLQDTPTDLTQLALELGFSSHSHFTDAFRREFGQTPSETKRARI